MTLTRENFMELEGVLQTVYDIQQSKLKDYVPKLFNVATSKRSQEKHFGIGGIGLMKKWTGQVNYDTIGKRWETTYRHQKYSDGLQFEREIFDNNEYKQHLEKTTKLLAISAHNTKQEHAYSVFNNAFDTAFLGSDGKPLCALAGATGHPYSPDNAADTQGNAGVLALTPTNIETTVTAMHRFVDDRGNKLGVNPRLLLVGDHYRVKAKEIVGSDKVPYSGDNTINVWNDELDYLYIPGIEGKKWMLVDPDLMNIFLNWYNNRIPKLEYEDNFNTEVVSYKEVGLWSFNFDEWYWCYGHQAQ